MKHPGILAAIERSKWAITPEALQGVLAALDQGLTAADYSTFHALDKDQKSALVANLENGDAGTRYTFRSGSTGLLYIDGPIIPRADLFSDVSGITSIENLVAEFQALESDPSISSIVLLLDTPGGNVVGVSEFARMVRNSAKPTVSFVYGMAASAGYWIASAADRLILADTGEVGSIGVVATYRDTSQRDQKNGVTTLEIVSSQSPLKRPDLNTPEGRASIQTVLDDLAAVFISSVAEFRGVTPQTVQDTFGQGSMRVGSRAVALGMADQLGTLQGLLSELGTQPAVKKVYFSQSGPAAGQHRAAEHTRVEDTMSPEEKTAFEQAQQSAKESTARAEAAEAAAKDAPAKAAEAERARIQGIEALMGKFDKSSAAVRAAARTLIDSKKFEPSATAESVGLALLDAVATASSAEASATAAGARSLAEAASNIPGAGETGTAGTSSSADKEQEAAVGLGAAFKAMQAGA